MACVACGKDLAVNAKFCRHCGANQAQPPTPIDSTTAQAASAHACVKCGAALVASEKFCRSCGAQQRVQPATAPENVVEAAAPKQPTIAPPVTPPSSVPVPEPEATPAAAEPKVGPSVAVPPAPIASPSKSIVPVVVGAVLALALLGGGGAWMWDSKQKADAQVAELKKKVDEEAKARQKLEEEARVKKAVEEAAANARQEAEARAAKERQEAEARAAKEREELQAKLEAETKEKVEAAEKRAAAKAAPTSATPSSSVPCANIANCYQATLIAMSKNDFDLVRRIAEKIDTFNKPARGNRPAARKLNDDGLRAMRQNDFIQAATIFAKAQREDHSDVEIASNLGFARVKAGDFPGASQALGDALLLNPRRASTWVPIAELIARRDRNANGALIALLVAYEWSTAKEKAINYYTEQAKSETHPQYKAAYEQALKRIGATPTVASAPPAQKAAGSPAQSAPQVAAAPTATSAPVQRDPQQLCKDKSNFISRSMCETKLCEREADMTNHPYCVQLRAKQSRQ